MKTISRLFVVAGMAALLSGCQDDAFKSQGQKYAEAFFETYGEVREDQEWNLATQMTVTVDPVKAANQIQVYALLGEQYYRVALYRDVKDMVTIPFDAPASTDQLLVDIDGFRYMCAPGQTVVNNRLNRTFAQVYQFDETRPSRAVGDDNNTVLRATNDGSQVIDSDHDFTPNVTVVFNSAIPNLDNQVTVSFKVKALKAGTVRVALQDNSVWSWQELEKKNVTTEWTTVSMTVPSHEGSDKNPKNVLKISLNNEGANVFYFDEFSVSYNGTQYVDNGDLEGDDRSKIRVEGDGGTGNFPKESETTGDQVPNSGNGGDNGGGGNGGGNTGGMTNVDVSLTNGGLDNDPDGLYKVENYSNGDVYQPQLVINGTFPISSVFTLSFDIYAEHDMTLQPGLQHAEDGKYYIQPMPDFVAQAGQWVHYEARVIVSTFERQCIVINLNPTDAQGNKIDNVYYFDNIKINDRYVEPTLGNAGSNHEYGIMTIVDDFEAGNPDVEVGPNLAWIVAAEDMGAIGDVDFNDVVFRLEFLSTNVKAHNKDWTVVDNDVNVSNPTYAPRMSRTDSGEDVLVLSRNDDGASVELGGVKITALAAGGQLPVFLHYYNATTRQDWILTCEGAVQNSGLTGQYTGEWHHWFADANYVIKDDAFVMINTGCQRPGHMPYNGAINSGVIPAEMLGEFTMSNFSQVFVNHDYTTASVQSGFYIAVGERSNGTPNEAYRIDGQHTIVGLSANGKAPMMFMIPDVGPGGSESGWCWPKEQMSILRVYPSFRNWYSADHAIGDLLWYIEGPHVHTDAVYHVDRRSLEDLRNNGAGSGN